MADEKCKGLAMLKRHWPGREPDLVCIEHGLDTRKILEAIGWPLAGVLVPLDIKDVMALGAAETGHLQCACSSGHPQEVHTGGGDEDG